MTDAPNEMWACYAHDGRLIGTAAGPVEFWPRYILATPSALAASPEGKALVVEAEECVMRIAAGLFPGGYDRNLAQIAAAIRAKDTP